MKSKLPLAAALLAVALLTAALLAAQPARGQAYPFKPVRFLVAVFPGSPIDVLARLLAPRLSDALGQPVVVENRGGAGGTIGMAQLAKMPPDGHSIGIMPMPVTVAPSLYPLQYDTLRDLAPVVQLVWQYNILVVNPALPAHSVPELIALLKANPGRFPYASGGNGTRAHLSGEFFKIHAGVDMVHVPYKTLLPALTDVIAGRVSILFGASAPTLPHVRAGKLRALGVTGPVRMAPLPEVPTVAEAGLAGFQVGDWQGVIVPAATPAEIVERLNAEFRGILDLPDVRKRLEASAMEPVGGTPEQFGALIRSEIAKWERVVKAAGIKTD
ncbi:MAG: tripartite tricarboxylate transporter substrate binding protein [Burkholderiales bacterium]|nr:tripartite tricarboxylate transporter substrate binding protein [Burkholderiales bacterium]